MLVVVDTQAVMACDVGQVLDQASLARGGRTLKQNRMRTGKGKKEIEEKVSKRKAQEAENRGNEGDKKKEEGKCETRMEEGKGKSS